MRAHRCSTRVWFIALAAATAWACSSSSPASAPEGSDGGGAGTGADGAAGPDGAGRADGGGGADGGGDAGAGRGPAYAGGTAGCPAADGTRRIKLVNNCREARWFKLDARTTPTWARPTTCAWAGERCTDVDGTAQCTAIAKARAGAETGPVYCKSTGTGGATCACNPYFELKSGAATEIALPAGASFASGTGWLARECNALGADCVLGDSAATNSVFEWTYDPPGGSLTYDISAVDAWTTTSAVGVKSCGGARDPNDTFRCSGTGCRFDVATQCPDGSPAFPPAPAGCATCPVKNVGAKLVIDGSCGPCPDGASANRVPTGTAFNAGLSGEWTWSGSADFATAFGYDEGAHAARRYTCTKGTCAPASAAANTCLAGCALCTIANGNAPTDGDACIKYCCPDVTKTYGAATYRYDSAGCTALGVQRGTDYTASLKAACPYVYTYGYEDHSSTFVCDTSASLLVQACPDPVDFPSTL